jgi:HEAT repeat protein
MKKSVLTILIALACFGALAAEGRTPTADMLLRDLAGDNDAARVNARQLLPREDTGIVEKLLPLIGHPNQQVWHAAWNAARDFANEVSGPGREKDREQVCGWMMAMLAPDQSADMKKRILRLLPVVIPEGYGVAPVAALLKDEELRERARACLQETGTLKAALALRDALEGADPAFQRALLQALSRLRKTETLQACAAMTESADPAVRAASVLALSWAGDPVHMKSVLRVAETADDATRRDAWDYLLRYTDAMARNGGNFDLAMSIYRHVLKESADPIIQSAAVASMGRYGDVTVLEPIREALRADTENALVNAAAAAFAALEGPASQQKLLDIYPDLSEEVRYCLINVFGRKQNPEYLGLLDDALLNGPPVFQEAALRALADSELEEALTPVIAYAEKREGDARAAALAALENLAKVYRNNNAREAAGTAWLALYEMSASAEMKAAALDGIKEFPTPAAFDVIMSQIDGAEIDTLPTGMLAGVALSLMKDGQQDKADQLMASLLPRINSAAALQEVLAQLGGEEGAEDFMQRLGVLRTWHLAGPFAWSKAEGFQDPEINVGNIDPAATFTGKGGAEFGWKKVTTPDPAGHINLMGEIGAMDNAAAYAYTSVVMAEAVEAQVRAGSDDGIRIWVNGEEVHADNVDRGVTLDDDIVPVQLKAGTNTIAAQVVQNAGGWGFCMRLTKMDGTVLPFEYAE